jgi:hypothetical protein
MEDDCFMHPLRRRRHKHFYCRGGRVFCASISERRRRRRRRTRRQRIAKEGQIM